MSYSNKKIYTAYLLPSLIQVMIAAIIAVILNYKGIELGYTAPVGLLLIAFGGVSTAFFGARFQCKYNNKNIKDIVTDFFNIKQPIRFYLLVLLFLFLGFAGVITREGFITDNPVTFILFFLKAILVGGIEEIGWRYTFQQEMERRHPYPAATIITFLGWSIWHILYFCVDGSIYYFSTTEIIFFLIGLLTNCFVLSAVYNKTKSLWLCVMTHALINTGAQLSPYVLPIISVLSSMACIILACVIVIEPGRKIDVKSLNAEDTEAFFSGYWKNNRKKYLLTLLLAILEFIVLILLSFVGLLHDIPEIILLDNRQDIRFMLMSVYFLIILAIVVYMYRSSRFFYHISRIVSEDCDPHKYREVYENLETNHRFLRGKAGQHFYLTNFYVASCIYTDEYEKGLNKLELLRQKNKKLKLRLAICEYYEGYIAIARNDVEKAKACLEKIKDLTGSNSEKGKRARNARDLIIGLTGSIALTEGEYENAETLINQRLEGRKDRISRLSLLYSLGMAKQNLGKVDEARKCLEEAVTLSGDADFDLIHKIREAYRECSNI